MQRVNLRIFRLVVVIRKTAPRVVVTSPTPHFVYDMKALENAVYPIVCLKDKRQFKIYGGIRGAMVALQKVYLCINPVCTEYIHVKEDTAENEFFSAMHLKNVSKILSV